jgi:hypothetical protein
MFLKPTPGLDVPDIDRGGLLATAGREVTPSTYWQRRIDDKDVIVVDPADTPVTSIVAIEDAPTAGADRPAAVLLTHDADQADTDRT